MKVKAIFKTKDGIVGTDILEVSADPERPVIRFPERVDRIIRKNVFVNLNTLEDPKAVSTETRTYRCEGILNEETPIYVEI